MFFLIGKVFVLVLKVYAVVLYIELLNIFLID